MVFSSAKHVWKSLEGHACNARQWLHSRGLGSMLFPPCYLFPSFFIIFFSFLFPSSFFFFFLENLQRTGKTSRPFSQEGQRERERESGHELLFRDVAYYNGPPRGEYRTSRGEPLEDVFENVGARFSLGA